MVQPIRKELAENDSVRGLLAQTFLKFRLVQHNEEVGIKCERALQIRVVRTVVRVHWAGSGSVNAMRHPVHGVRCMRAPVVYA